MTSHGQRPRGASLLFLTSCINYQFEDGGVVAGDSCHRFSEYYWGEQGPLPDSLANCASAAEKNAELTAAKEEAIGNNGGGGGG